MYPTPHIDGLWAIERVYGQTTLAAMFAHIPKNAVEYNRETDAFEYAYNVVNGVAEFTLKGPMSRDTDWFTRYIGGCGTQLLADAIVKAADDPTVLSGITRINSPGGATSSVEPMTDAIKAFRAAGKVMNAFADGQCCSAAYGVASECNKIYATRGSSIGSIGTLLVLHDASKMFEKMGVEVVIVSTGDMKGAGVYGTKITDEQKASFQSWVNAVNKVFVADIAQGRGWSADEAKAIATGDVWVGEDAKSKGLVDDIKSYSKLLESMSTTTGTPGWSSQRSNGRRVTMSEDSVVDQIKSLLGIGSGQNESRPTAANNSVVNALTGKLTELGITSVAQLDELKSQATLGAEYRTELLKSAEQQATRLYGVERGPVIAAGLKFATAADIQTASKAWATEADAKFATTPEKGATRVSAPTPMPEAQSTEGANSEDAYRELMAMTSLGNTVLKSGGN